MVLLDQISKTFGCSFSIANSEEKFESATFILIANDISLPNESDLENLFLQINAQDKLEIQLNLAETNTIVFQKSKDLTTELIKEIQNRQQFYQKGQRVELKLLFIKKNDPITVYSINAFITFLKGLSTEQLLINFSNALSTRKLLIFNCFDLTEVYHSKTVFFRPKTLKNNFELEVGIAREETLNKTRTTCSFTFSQPIILLPEDFLFTSSNIITNVPLSEIMNKLLSALLVTTIFDITSLHDNKLIYRLNGYKSINGTIEVTPLKSYKNYYDIYDWIYNGGNLSDKLGLARNIISLHLGEENNLEITDSTYSSIVSSHKVYEKQNIKQYIELRNKISDQIYGFNEKANKIIETFAQGFQKSALAFVSLFSTIVITKVLTTKNFSNIFTFDATIISFLFLIGSLIYFFVSLWEVNAQLNRFKESYSNMKKRNEDLLTSDDIDRILNSDNEHTNDLLFIRRKRVSYSILWLSFLVLFLSTTLFLHYEYSQNNPNDKNIFYSNKNIKQLKMVKEDSIGRKIK